MDWGGFQSPGSRYACRMPYARLWQVARASGVLQHLCDTDAGLSASHLTHLEKRTKESDMCVSQRGPWLLYHTVPQNKELQVSHFCLTTLESARPEVGSSGWKSTAFRVVSDVLSAALEIIKDQMQSTLDRTHNHIRSPRETTSSRWNNVGKESWQNGSVTSGKGLALRAGHGGPSPEPISCRWTTRADPAARAGHRVPIEGQTRNSSFGGLPWTSDNQLRPCMDKGNPIHQVLECSPTNREHELGLDRRETESELEATYVPDVCLPTRSRGLGHQGHMSFAKPPWRKNRGGCLEV
ncbi:hypothetical protein FXO38_07897 [Capsicum annuum]|nr:hypothetical protein FXO38_07897 [Capsicum annuum]